MQDIYHPHEHQPPLRTTAPPTRRLLGSALLISGAFGLSLFWLPPTLLPPTETRLAWLAFCGALLWVTYETRRAGRLRAMTKQQQQAEAALRASEARYQLLFAAMADGVVLQDADGAIILANPAAERILGLSIDQLRGLTSVDPRWRAIHADLTPFPGDQHPAMVALRTGQPVHNIIMGVHKPDDSQTWILVNAEPLLMPDQPLPHAVVTTFSEITRQRQLESALRGALATQDALLHEIHHRVKNNLQVVASLLKFQAALFTDPAVCAAFEDSQHRVRSMVFVHETLYRSDDLARVEAVAYITPLVQNLARVYAAAEQGINVTLTIAVGALGVETATPLGLLITELVSNAFKHGFVRSRGGNISVALREQAGSYTLVVADDGIGMPGDIDLQQSESLGMQLIWALTNQLEGQIAITTDGGTSVTISFVPAADRTPATI